MKKEEKIKFAINQIAINNCDGSANEDGIKAVRLLQETLEGLIKFKENNKEVNRLQRVCFEVKDLLGDERLKNQNLKNLLKNASPIWKEDSKKWEEWYKKQGNLLK